MNKIVNLNGKEKTRMMLLEIHGLDKEKITEERKKIEVVSKEESERLGKEIYEIIKKKRFDEDTKYSEIESLAYKGANLNYKDNSQEINKGNTSLLFACRKNKIKTFTLLARLGADINLTNNYGTTCCMAAARHNNYEILNILIALGANINARCYDGDTAIMSAKRNNSVECFNLLEEEQAYLNTHNLMGESIIDMEHKVSPTMEADSLLLSDDFSKQLEEKSTSQLADELLIEAIDRFANIPSLSKEDMAINNSIKQKILTKYK